MTSIAARKGPAQPRRLRLLVVTFLWCCAVAAAGAASASEDTVPADPDAVRDEIKSRYERRLKEIFE